MSDFSFLSLRGMVIILVALMASLVTGLPQLAAISADHDQFQGIYPIQNNDEPYYLARGQDVLDGHPTQSHPYYLEHKNDPAGQFWIPDYLLAQTSYLLGLNIPEGNVLFDFVLPFIIVLLTFAVCFRMTENWLISLGAVIYLHFVIYLGIFGRPISPQFNFIFFLTATLASLSSPFWASINLGLLFYVYTYYWTFFLVLYGIYILLNYFYLKDKKESRKFLWVIMGATAIGSGYIWQNLEAIQLTYYAESLARLGMIESHFPSGLKIVLLGTPLLAIFLFGLKKEIIPKEKKSLSMLSGVLAAIVAVNQHVITGKNLEFSSHYQMLSIVWFIFTAVFLIECAMKKNLLKPGVERRLIFVALLISLLWGVFNTYKFLSTFSYLNETTLINQYYAPVLTWLRENTPKDSVVFSRGGLTGLIPFYTSNNQFYNPAGNLNFMPNDEVIERFLIYHYFEPEFNRDFIKKHERDIWRVYYIDRYAHNLNKLKVCTILRIKCRPEERLPKREVDAVLRKRNELIKIPFENLLERYQTDYLVIEKKTARNWKLARYHSLEPVATINNFVVYKKHPL